MIRLLSGRELECELLRIAAQRDLGLLPKVIGGAVGASRLVHACPFAQWVGLPLCRLTPAATCCRSQAAGSCLTRCVALRQPCDSCDF